MQTARASCSETSWIGCSSLGIRQITPIHLTDNAFGGTAIYMRLLDVLNVFVTGRHYELEDAWDSGIRYRIDHDGTDVVDGAERMVVSQGKPLSRPPAMSRGSLVDHVPGIGDLKEDFEHPGGGHANRRGLTMYGIMLLQEMMRRGMIIDIDHMSQKATDTTLDMAEAHDYPVVSSHTWFRDLTFSAEVEFGSKEEGAAQYGTADVHKVAHEAAKRADQVERIGRPGRDGGPDPEPGRRA